MATGRSERPRRPSLLARRRRGPRSLHGKRRSSLNRLKRGLCPGWVEQQLRARGEDPEAFRRLHRDLIGCLGPEHARERVIVEGLAETWWEKMRRLRNWVGLGLCDTHEIDARLDDQLQRFAWAMRFRNRKWRWRLESALGKGLYGPSLMRKRMEARLPVLGGKRASQVPASRRRDPLRDFEERMEGLEEMLSEMYNRPPSAGGGK